MAENKSFNSRIVLKHDVEANWLMAVNFIPKDGEVIIYDADMDNPVRIKIGNGIDKVNDLPFFAGEFDVSVDDIDEICGTTFIDANEVGVEF